jgi:large subunit ribosomal protein L23
MPERFRVVVRPVVTEKSSATYAARKEYTFEAAPTATKPQIREAIEALFGVKVERVRTLVLPAKRRTRGRFEGRLPRWKKAMVRLREGDTLPIFEG